LAHFEKTVDNIQDESRKKAAQVAVAEVKARLSNGYAKYILLSSIEEPTVTSVISSAGGVTNLVNAGNDFTVTAVAFGNVGISITATMGDQSITGYWLLPTK